MIETILAISFINIIIHIFLKPRQGILCCGIIAWGGKNTKSFNKHKFDILGIFNDSRGGDSCGITIDGEIYHGIRPIDKLYKDFLVEKNYNAPKLFPTVIAHTRKSSVGTINGDNAHPFGFGHNEEFDSFSFLGVHNGTLYNHDEFCKDYGVEISVYNNNVFDRRKIDSEVLLESIYKSESFRPLSAYYGGAAVVFTSTLEANVLYAFHGASAEYEGGKIEEERPLYYYIEGKNSMYISSLAEGLIAIGGVIEKNVFEFEHNVVYKITDGDVRNAEKFPVSRKAVLQRRKPYVHVPAKVTSHAPNSMVNAYMDGEYDFTSNRQRNKALRAQVKENIKRTRRQDFNVDNIYDEKPLAYKRSKVIYQKLRYTRNGHNCNGVFTYINGYGLHFLCDKSSSITDSVFKIIDAPFDKEKGEFLEKDADITHNDHAIVPFPKVGSRAPFLVYIYNGIMMETKMDYDAVLAKRVAIDWINLSNCSKYPICDDRLQRPLNHQQNIRHYDEPYTNNFSPLGSDKIYHIENGNLKKVEIIEDLRAANDSQVKLEFTGEQKKVIPLMEAKAAFGSCFAIDPKTVADYIAEEMAAGAPEKKIIDFMDEEDSVDFEALSDGIDYSLVDTFSHLGNHVDDDDKEDDEDNNLTIEIMTSLDGGLANILCEAQETKKEFLKLLHDGPEISEAILLVTSIEESVEQFYDKHLLTK